MRSSFRRATRPARVESPRPSSGSRCTSARRAIEAELDQAGAAVDTLAIEAVDEIACSGTGAKEKLVSAAA
jgi:hypothetical protein